MKTGGGRAVRFLSVFGHTNIDYLAHVARIPGPDQSAAFTGPLRTLGGTAANVAAWASALGTPALLASMVGLDFPEPFRKELRRNGVDLSRLRVLRGSTTPVCWIFSDARERQAAYINQGAAVDGAALPVDRAAIAASQVVHIGTGPATHHSRVAVAARRARRVVAFDPAQELSYGWRPEPFRRMLRNVDMLFLNDGERLLARKYLGLRSDRAMLRLVPSLVLTHGTRGSEFLSEGEHVSCPIARASKVVNTTGAGDAFRGGYYAALYRRKPARTRLAWGASAASLAVEAPGTMPPARARAAFRARLERGFSLVEE